MANLDLIITDGKIELVGLLSVPDGCLGLVLFAHGSGSSRYSPRNVSVARILNQAGIGTLLFDLLTPEEAELTGTGRSKVFNIPFLASRLQMATHWVNSKEQLKKLNIAYLGASTGAAAALLAAANLGDQIVAVISRGGRPDLAMSCLDRVSAEVVLIVGSEDDWVLEQNRLALQRLRRAHLEVILGATHLFEEPGALERVSQLTRDHLHEIFRKSKGVWSGGKIA